MFAPMDSQRWKVWPFLGRTSVRTWKNSRCRCRDQIPLQNKRTPRFPSAHLINKVGHSVWLLQKISWIDGGGTPDQNKGLVIFNSGPGRMSRMVDNIREIFSNIMSAFYHLISIELVVFRLKLGPPPFLYKNGWNVIIFAKFSQILWPLPTI